MKHLLVDGHNLIYRGYHTSNLTDANGMKISGAFAAIKMVMKLIERFTPQSVVLAWDGGRCKERIKLYPEYKAQRADNRDPKDVEAIKQNIIMARDMFDTLPVKQICIDDTEADDVLGYLSHRLGGKKILVTNDQDFIQLVKKGTFLFLPNKNKILSNSNIEEFLGFPLDKFLIHKAMVGDNSDNIKGVKGVGPKTATKVVLGEKNVKTEWMDTIERNVTLMNIGLFLTKMDIATIHKDYAMEKQKKVSVATVRSKCAKYGFKSLMHNFYQIERTFGKLRTAQPIRD